MPVQPESTWPHDRVVRLGRLLASGCSASQAAAEMGCSRNSIIGIARRKNLPFKYATLRRKAPPATEPTPPRRSTPFRPKVRHLTNQGNRLEIVELNAPAPLPASRDVEPPIDQRHTILELTGDTCRWPFGDPGTVEFYFCGGMVIEGKPYCPHHCRMAYRQPGQREEQAA